MFFLRKPTMIKVGKWFLQSKQIYQFRSKTIRQLQIVCFNKQFIKQAFKTQKVFYVSECQNIDN